MRPAALAGAEPSFLSLRRGIVEFNVRSAGQSGWAGRATVDFSGDHGVDEGVGCDVAGADGLPPFGVSDGIGAGDSLRLE